MSRRRDRSPAEKRARVFAALGDGTRLQLISRLSVEGPRSISALSAESRLTRQAVTKHLRVLEGAGLIRSERRGRENRFEFTPRPMEEATSYLAEIAQQWNDALRRLKEFVE